MAMSAPLASLVLALIVATQVAAVAQTRPGTSNLVPPSDAPVYQPPRRGAPTGRVGGGARGVPSNPPAVVLVAPSHVGLTTEPQPVLYWYLREPAASPVEILLVDLNVAEPLVKLRLTQPALGLHRFALAEHGARLKAGTQYEWSVAIVRDPERRALDSVSAAFIERVDPPEALRKGSASAMPWLYASEGIWYDAFHSLSRLIATRPTDPKLREFRASLLEQIDLGDVARYERAPTIR